MSILKRVFGDFVDARQLRRASRDLFKQRQQASGWAMSPRRLVATRPLASGSVST